MNNDNTIAIVGNGFDLAHKYNTQYSDFVAKTESSFLYNFRCLCEEEKIDEWSYFEDSLKCLLMKSFDKLIINNVKIEDYDFKINQINCIFRQIKELLVDYLDKEINSKTLVKQKKIEHYLSPSTFSINFNYTPTLEYYTDNVFYIHGSLKERDIILGYDFREDSDLMSFDDKLWRKDLCREALEFKRYLKQLLMDDDIIKKYMKDFDKFQRSKYSGKGVSPELQTQLSCFNYIDTFEKRNLYLGETSRDCSKYETAVIIGHGLKADQSYLNDLFKRLTSLNTIVIFYYSVENKRDLEEKAQFLSKYANTIEWVKYE